MIPIHESAGAITFAIRVHPRAKKTAINGELGNALKLAITAPPVEGKANEACIEFFAKLLKVPRSSVTIAAGHSSRNKLVRVTGISAVETRRALMESSRQKADSSLRSE
jgi:uncharacterized protein (TIGR00251 family)